ncbi:hypothetical protein LMG31506_06325 [Cupriavidus yeoncheonensis]|uniref:Uncharacterized protein n=2 Tax=Cupriavidus yeoncheonensis TaxID=1462994 RepID=A0A916J0X5_9BURK|nr:hypothetical protein LMG31506_06325 [Cupriavidus yeoncheonensis]
MFIRFLCFCGSVNPALINRIKSPLARLPISGTASVAGDNEMVQPWLPCRYGIKLTIDGKEPVIARPSDGHGESKRDYFSENEVIPEQSVLNIRIDNLKRILNKALGIDPELKVPYGGNSSKLTKKFRFVTSWRTATRTRPTTIAPPDYLYIRPGDGRFQEGIERTFRMAIGAETVRAALARNQLADLEREKAAQARKQEVYDKASHALSDELPQLDQEARARNSIDGSTRTDPAEAKGYDSFSAHFSERDRLIHLYSKDLSTMERMSDIGRASSYLYLHVAYFLALHELANLQHTT